ncbi:alpha-L-rhamnosidase-related protein [Actinacidiphila glaucinigra]|uniref:Alpha-L-rhamnosidase n=1 Tax=Actinacidiphila glaucinigra TaxID=235986 RepID=A0A239JLJ8_9ACTN|nr:alpha-L-rhamnosidase C-terminal domain-containing protein [Actinacidiphila glaucinigra]SNT06422.1 alpha-L-rhamnosidase [Actinacidiphila glaucinigra]
MLNRRNRRGGFLRTFRRSRVIAAVALLTTMGSAAVQAEAAPPQNPDWQSYVLGPATAQVLPADVETRGSVTNPNTLVTGQGSATTLTTAAGGAPASVLLDFGKNVAGTPYIDVTARTGSPTLSLATAEARQYIRTPASTTVSAAASSGATQVTVASTANLEVGNTITFGTGTTAQARTITAFDTSTRRVTVTPALTRSLTTQTRAVGAPGAPSSDESRGLAGVGGIDTLRPTGTGRTSGSYHGGFRFVLLTLTSPGSVSLSAAGVTFQGVRATAADYKGWFMSSDDQLNRMWYSGAYTLQLNLKPAGLNGLADKRIYDGAKRDRSIWTGDLLVQGPTAISTLGDAGADYVKSSLNVLLAAQRSDGAIPGSPDFSKGSNPAGSPLFYSNNYSGYGARAAIDYYRYTGDRNYITSVLSDLRAELAYNDRFLTANRLVASNDRDYWQASQSGEVTKYSIDYYILLKEMAWLERQVGSASNATANDAKAESIKQAVNTRLWSTQLGAYGQSSAKPNVLVEDANALALQYGFVPADRRTSVLNALKTLWTSYGAIMGPGLVDPTGHTIEPFGNGMETAGRFAVGDATGAFDLMRRTWGPMVDRSNPLYTGAFWEFKNSNGGVNRATASLAHGWAASPTVQLTEQVLGVTPVNPGYATWSIKPHTGNLEWAQGSVPTSAGDIAVQWQSDSSAFTLHAGTPTGTSGTIAVPVTAQATVTVNGRTVCTAGSCDAYQGTIADGYAQLTVPGGTYDITVSRG